MSACICILGVAWLGDTFVSNNIDWIKAAIEVIQGHPWLLAVIFFFASALLYSQAATARSTDADGSGTERFSADRCCFFRCGVNFLFILPTYPTLVAAEVQMDDTGTTRIGKFVFNHPFFIPGTLGVATRPFASASCWNWLHAVMINRGFRPRFLPPTNILPKSVV